MAHRAVRLRDPALWCAGLLAVANLGWLGGPTGAVDVPSDLHAARGTAPRLVPMQVYFGTTHFHTGAFNDHGEDNSTPQDIFETAKANNFDFLVLTEHSGPSGPTDPVAYYADARAQAAAATQDDVFVG